MVTVNGSAQKSATASNSNQPAKKKVENLARTGIEYPIMKDLGHAPFINTVAKEKEPLLERPCTGVILDEYIRAEIDRTASNVNF